MQIGRSIAARAVVDGTMKESRRLTMPSAMSAFFAVVPNLETMNSARRLATPDFSIPEVMTNAASISQITS